MLAHDGLPVGRQHWQGLLAMPGPAHSGHQQSLAPQLQPSDEALLLRPAAAAEAEESALLDPAHVQADSVLIQLRGKVFSPCRLVFPGDLAWMVADAEHRDAASYT